MEENDTGQTAAVAVTDEFESACSSPLISAPSSPDGAVGGVGGGWFYSAPASPIHFLLSSSSTSHVDRNNGGCFEFEFTVQEEETVDLVVPADELFLNGQIRPMKLSSHLELPQVEDDDDDDDDDDDANVRGRDIRSRSLRRRRARSMSPTPSLRSNTFQWLGDFQPNVVQQQQQHKVVLNENENENETENEKETETETTPSGASSRSSSVGRTSKRWVQLKDFLYRSKSEGTNTGNYKFWTSLSRKSSSETANANTPSGAEIGVRKKKEKEKKEGGGGTTTIRKAVNGVGKRTGTRSPHELHYTTNRAQAEELRRKTYLPYKQGLLGCLGFSSKSYGAMNGFARALNPVSSR